MKEGMIKVALSEKGSIKKEWEHPCHTDLPELLQAITFVKLSVNDYLTDLISQQKDIALSDQVELTEASEFEEETKDNITGFIEHVNCVNEKPKRKVTDLNQAKKIRK